MTDDLAELRRRRDALAPPLGGRNPDAGRSDPPGIRRSYTGQVYDGGHMPAVVPAVYLTRPADVSATQEEEGFDPDADETITVDGNVSVPVLILGPRVPAVDEYVTADQVDGLWIGEVGAAARKPPPPPPNPPPPTGNCATCTAGWPSTLYLHAPFGVVTITKNAPGTFRAGNWSGLGFTNVADGSTLDAMGGFNPFGPFASVDHPEAHGVAVRTPVRFEMGCTPILDDTHTLITGSGTTIPASTNTIYLYVLHPIALYWELQNAGGFVVNWYPGQSDGDYPWAVHHYGPLGHYSASGSSYGDVVSPAGFATAYQSATTIAGAPSCGVSTGISVDFHVTNMAPFEAFYNTLDGAFIPYLAASAVTIFGSAGGATITLSDSAT